MRQPDIYQASTIKNWPTARLLPNGTSVPARPVGHNAFSWRWRWKLAIDVLLGRCDVLRWEESCNPTNTD